MSIAQVVSPCSLNVKGHAGGADLKAHILIAEDEMGIRTGLTILLEEQGYHITTVDDGQKALQAIRGNKFDLVISDVRMPGLTGLELLREIQLMPNKPEIIIITAYGSIETAIAALKNGARDFLIKPFSNDLLMMTVKRTLEMRELSEENRRLRQLEQMKQEFITMIAHELRTPLTAIKGYLRLITADLNGDFLRYKHKDYLKIIDHNTEKLQNIISKMIDMGSLDSNEISLQTVSINSISLVREVLENLQATSQKKDIQIDIDMEPSLRPIIVDPHRMKQLITFMLDNAIAFSPPHRHIWITLKQWEGETSFGADNLPGSYVDFSRVKSIDYLQLSVRDEGPGIPEDKLSQIFEQFYQIEDLYIRQVGGMGISLALCKRLVEIMGGQIWVKSRQGAGSIFTIILPWNYAQANDANYETQAA